MWAFQNEFVVLHFVKCHNNGYSVPKLEYYAKLDYYLLLLTSKQVCHFFNTGQTRNWLQNKNALMESTQSELVYLFHSESWSYIN